VTTAPAARISVILLAAGESSRMAQPKQSLLWQGVPLLRYHLEQLLATTAQEIIVVLGYKAGEFAAMLKQVNPGGRAKLALNPNYRYGKTTSVKIGLENIAEDATAIAILAVDQPRPAAVLQRLFDAHVQGKNLISAPAFQGKHGHPPIFDASLVAELNQISEEKQGLHEVVERHRDGLRAVDFDSPAVLTNLNTPEDYQQALKQFGQKA
jgi:molybdenum cofactor cytidylyltransferase